MRKSVNPGRWLDCEGSFTLSRSLAEIENGVAGIDRTLGNDPDVVLDRESGDQVSLAGLLRSFIEDPTERRTGRIKITIEPY